MDPELKSTSDISLRVAARVKELAGEHWEQYTFLVGVSGGLDSTVLLHALSRHFKQEQLVAVHFNYHLRGEESDGDQIFVESFCRQLGVQCDVQHRRFDANSGLGNLQDWARGVRYKHLSTAYGNHKAVALTAHHAQDQAESILMRIMQGYPPFLCTGMEAVQPWKSGRNLLRPMLEITPEEIRAYAKANGIAWREDSSNRKDDYLRNRVRHHVLPSLETAFGPAWSANLVKFGKSLALVQCGEAAGLGRDAFGNPALPLHALEGSYPWLALARLTGHYITPGKSGEIVRTLKAGRLKSVPLEIGTLVRERDNQIIFLDAGQNVLPVSVGQLPGTIPLPDGRVARLEAGIAPDVEAMVCEAGQFIYYLKHTLPLAARAWQDSDTIMPLGTNSTTKRLKHLVKNLTHITARETTWVLESEAGILFASMGLVEEAAAVAPGERCVKMVIEPAPKAWQAL